MNNNKVTHLINQSQMKLKFKNSKEMVILHFEKPVLRMKVILYYLLFKSKDAALDR